MLPTKCVKIHFVLFIFKKGGCEKPILGMIRRLVLVQEGHDGQERVNIINFSRALLSLYH